MSTPSIASDATPLRTLPAFMRFWYARLTGTTGNQMLMVAVGWQMYDLTGSAWDLGLVGLLQFLPALLLTLVAGHVADRHDRSRILAIAMAAQTVVALVLMLATHGHWASRWLLLALSVAIGTAKAFQMPAQQALVPSLVPASVLPRALAFSSAGMQAAIIGGPALGGFIYVAGADVVYATCAACFIAAGVLFLRIGHPHVPPPKEPVSLHTVLAGFQFIWQRPVVLGAISLDLFAVLLGGATALLPMFAKDVGHAMFAAVAVYGVATMVFGVSTSFVLSLVALWVSGAADMVSVVIRQSLVQLETPDAMRGRVAAVNSIFIGASNQLGEFESGATAALLGPVGSVLLGGAGTLFIAGLWFKLFPDLARRERLTERA
jgi:MFS family permease